jgi:hypothetical protein
MMMLPRTISIALTSVLVALASQSIPEIDKCTTIVVGKKAGTDGPMTTHTADCSDCDFRVSKVTSSHSSIISSPTLSPPNILVNSDQTPAMDWEPHSTRPLYLYKGNYPATITTTRGTTWHPKNLEGTPEQLEAWGQESLITGHIPQVHSTATTSALPMSYD